MEDPDAHLARCLPPPAPLRASLHRAAPIELPADPGTAAALVVGLIKSGGTAFDRSGAIEAASARLSKLKNADPETALGELLGHAAVLDALFLAFAARAATATNLDAATRLGKLALGCQNSYSRTLAVYEGLVLQKRGRGSVAVGAGHATTNDPAPRVRRKRPPRPAARAYAEKHGAWSSDGYSTVAYVRRLLSLLGEIAPDSVTVGVGGPKALQGHKP